MASMMCSLIDEGEPCMTVPVLAQSCRSILRFELAFNVAAVLETCCLVQTAWSAHARSGTAPAWSMLQAEGT
jgi:hypothetical protein